MDINIVDNPQQGGDSSIAKQPDPAINGDIPQMDMERVLPRQQSTGLSRGIQQLGSPNVFADSGDNQIIVAKDSINQVLMGNQPNFGEGFYVTKQGIDAKTAKSLDDFVFNSNQNIFKIVTSDYVNTYFTAASYSYTKVAHNLGYIPIVQAYVYGRYSNTGRSFFPLPYSLQTTLDTVGQVINLNITADVFADDQYVYFEGANATASDSPIFYIRYYLLQESIKPPDVPV